MKKLLIALLLIMPYWSIGQKSDTLKEVASYQSKDAWESITDYIPLKNKEICLVNYNENADCIYNGGLCAYTSIIFPDRHKKQFRLNEKISIIKGDEFITMLGGNDKSEMCKYQIINNDVKLIKKITINYFLEGFRFSDKEGNFIILEGGDEKGVKMNLFSFDLKMLTSFYLKAEAEENAWYCVNDKKLFVIDWNDKDYHLLSIDINTGKKIAEKTFPSNGQINAVFADNNYFYSWSNTSLSCFKADLKESSKLLSFNSDKIMPSNVSNTYLNSHFFIKNRTIICSYNLLDKKINWQTDIKDEKEGLVTNVREIKWNEKSKLLVAFITKAKEVEKNRFSSHTFHITIINENGNVIDTFQIPYSESIEIRNFGNIRMIDNNIFLQLNNKIYML